MQVPFFFEENLPSENEFILNEETSRHIAQVLRMKEGDNIRLTNGAGYIKKASVIVSDKKGTRIRINDTIYINPETSAITIAISLIKNINRFEWFLEKATETGVSAIIPFVSDRTEKQHLRISRVRNILVSAMLQSQQAWLPQICEPISLKEVFQKSYISKYIAHCINDEKKQLSDEVFEKENSIILIGPEGDFTQNEIDAAIENNFIPVSLGETRLRTETAGLVAAVLLLHKRK